MVATTSNASGTTGPSATAPAPTHAANATTVLVKVRRQDTPQGEPRWEQFRVPYGEGANVISVLQWIAAPGWTPPAHRRFAP